jgi:pyruvate formate lyase activating enzyme
LILAMTKGIVFNIQRYSLHDGPGIRTLVFLKGCPLRCLWCCNPESQRLQPEVEFFAAKCRGCGRCATACPAGAIDLAAPERIHRSRCDGCGRCVDACPAGALKLDGQEMTVEQVMAEVCKDAAYYRRSGGGLTLSGGEPLLQPEFAAGILRAAYNANLDTALETSGFASWETLEPVLPYTQLVLFDLKHADDAEHRRLAGVPLAPILENARRLAQRRHPMIIRVPLVPGLNTSEATLRAMANLVAELRPLAVHLMPFHQLGRDKYRRLGMDYGLAEMPDMQLDGRDILERAQRAFAAAGVEAQVGG